MSSIGQKYATYLKLKYRLPNKWIIRLIHMQLLGIILLLGIPGWLLSPRDNDISAWQSIEIVEISQLSGLTPESEIRVILEVTESLRWGFQNISVTVYEGLGSAATESVWNEDFSVFFSSNIWSEREIVLSNINFRANRDYTLRVQINDRIGRITKGIQPQTQIALSS